MELNAEQIIKALGCYIEKPHISECEKGCVYYEKSFGSYCCCMPLEDTLIEKALALIKELTEENERLRAEVRKLNIITEDTDVALYAYQHLFDIRADTVREAIARIEEKAESCDLYVANSHQPIDTIYQISKTQLDQIAQEILEGK